MQYSTDSDVHSPTSLLSVVHHCANHTPNNEFLVEDRGISLSYAQTYILTTQLIPARLRVLCPSLTSRPDVKAILLTHNSSLFPLSLLALWNLSVGVVPVSVSAEPNIWLGTIRLVDPVVIIAAPKLLSKLSSALQQADANHLSSKLLDITSLIPEEFLTQSGMVTRTSDFIPSCRRWLEHAYPNRETYNNIIINAPAPSIDGNVTALTLFTSSAVDFSTLKCVSYTHAMLYESSIRAMLMLGGTAYSSKPKRHLGWLPLSHCFEFCITFCGIILGTGGAYIFYDPSLSSPSLPPSTPLAPFLLSGLAYHSPVTSFTAIPAILPTLIEESSQADLERLRALESLGVGGAPTPEFVFQWAASQGIAYFNCSGATEAVGTVCIRRALEPSQRQNGLQIIPGLMGVLQKRVASDRFGELIIHGTYLPKGYDFRDSDVFDYDPTTGVTTYHTGDLYAHQDNTEVLSFLPGEPIPSYDPDRVALSGLTYIGRIDDMIVLKSGVKVNAIELERLLDAHVGILRSAVVGNSTGETLLALVQPQSENLAPMEFRRLVDVVLELNLSLPFEKRFRRENIFLTRDLPVTTKFTLNRKKIKKIMAKITNDADIPNFFPTLSESLQALATPVATDAPIPPMAAKRSRALVDCRRRLVTHLAQIFHVPESYFDGPNASLVDLPLTSLSSAQLAKALRDEFSVRITGAQLYGIHNIDDLYSIIVDGGKECSPTAIPLSTKEPSTLCTGSIAPDVKQPMAQDIVISGTSCRFAGGIDTLASLWSALLAPDEFIENLSRKRPDSRWEQSNSHEKMMFPSGWLDDTAFENVHSFAKFFGFPPPEVRAMSPNARLALQLGYESILDAGIAPKTLSGKAWGVFTSVNDSGWRERRAEKLDLLEYAKGMEGSADDAAGARLSYFLNLTGPAIEIKTACSSSAVALHQACSAIRNGDCEAAVVIAVTTHFYPAGAIFRSQNGIASANGKCTPFYDSADGFVPSEGAAAIVLQRSADAQVPAYGCIRATSVTQDGTSRGFFSPNPVAQRRLLDATLEKARCSPEDIMVLEAHGTGTQLGDAIELQAINQIFGGRKSELYIGSAKAVIGHTEECAGLAGVLKAILCFAHNAIPPQPRAGPLNEEIDFEASNVVIPNMITPFFQRDHPRLCGVSSFGLSGTLAHVIIEEPPFEPLLRVNSVRAAVFVISAQSLGDLSSCIRRYLLFFSRQHLQLETLETVCRTTQLGRDHFAIRRAWVVNGWRSLLDNLRDALVSPLKPLTFSSPKIGLWFGLPLSGSSLNVNNNPLFISKFAECQEAAWALDYEYFQEQLALSRCLTALGCNVCVVGGEGIAEYVAAVFAEVIPATSIFRLSGRVENGLSSVVVRSSQAPLDELLMSWRSDELKIVGQHGSDLFTLCGTHTAIASLASEVTVLGNLPRPTVLAPLASLHSPSVPVVSGYLGEVLEQEVATNIEYWNHVQDRVVQADVAWASLASQCDVVVNMGHAGDIAQSLGDKCISVHQNSLEGLIGRLFEVGCAIDWHNFTSSGRRAHIPPYSWATDTECN